MDIQLSWVLILVGAIIGTSVTIALIFGFGRSFFKRMDLEDRGQWDRPLAAPIPKDTVIATYHRRKGNHRHHRRYYRHRRAKTEKRSQ
jgi:hypothetical protein